MPNAQLPVTNYQSNLFEWAVYTLSSLGYWFDISDYDVIFTALGGKYKGKEKQISFVVKWVFCESFIVRTFWKYKNLLVLMILKVRKDFMVFERRDLLWSDLL